MKQMPIILCGIGGNVDFPVSSRAAALPASYVFVAAAGQLVCILLVVRGIFAGHGHVGDPAFQLSDGRRLSETGNKQGSPHILQQAHEREIVLYHGPQPAMLPALLGRSLVHVDDRWLLPDQFSSFLLFVEAANVAPVLLGLKKLELKATEQERFGVLSSRVRWKDMAHRGLTAEQLIEAVRHRDLRAIKSQLVMFEVEKSP